MIRFVAQSLSSVLSSLELCWFVITWISQTKYVIIEIHSNVRLRLSVALLACIVEIYSWNLSLVFAISFPRLLVLKIRSKLHWHYATDATECVTWSYGRAIKVNSINAENGFFSNQMLFHKLNKLSATYLFTQLYSYNLAWYHNLLY